MRTSFSRCLVAVCVVLGAATSASANPIALDVTSDTTAFSVGGFTNVGWQFSVNAPITIDGLGLFDFGGDGLSLSHQVGLWDNSGTLLAQTTVTNGSTPVASLSNAGDWLFESITPIILLSGTVCHERFFCRWLGLGNGRRDDYYGAAGLIPCLTSIGGSTNLPGPACTDSSSPESLRPMSEFRLFQIRPPQCCCSVQVSRSARSRPQAFRQVRIVTPRSLAAGDTPSSRSAKQNGRPLYGTGRQCAESSPEFLEKLAPEGAQATEPESEQ